MSENSQKPTPRMLQYTRDIEIQYHQQTRNTKEILRLNETGLTPYYLDRLIDIFCENLKRFLNKQELVNVVDKTRGY